MVLAMKLSITLKQSGYFFTISPLTFRSGFLDIPYCDGVPGSGVAPSGFWTFCFCKKRWQQILGLRIHMRFLNVPYRLSLTPQKADSAVGEYASAPCLGGPSAGSDSDSEETFVDTILKQKVSLLFCVQP